MTNGGDFISNKTQLTNTDSIEKLEGFITEYEKGKIDAYELCKRWFYLIHLQWFQPYGAEIAMKEQLRVSRVTRENARQYIERNLL